MSRSPNARVLDNGLASRIDACARGDQFTCVARNRKWWAAKTHRVHDLQVDKRERSARLHVKHAVHRAAVDHRRGAGNALHGDVRGHVQVTRGCRVLAGAGDRDRIGVRAKRDGVAAAESVGLHHGGAERALVRCCAAVAVAGGVVYRVRGGVHRERGGVSDADKAREREQ